MRAMNAPSDPQLESLRIPPHSIEAEQSVIGGLLRDNAALDRIADFMHADDFYRYDHRIIFEQIVKLINGSQAGRRDHRLRSADPTSARPRKWAACST